MPTTKMPTEVLEFPVFVARRFLRNLAFRRVLMLLGRVFPLPYVRFLTDISGRSSA
jgi:hypothetical protein